jgi:hypothetical protein
VDRGVNEHEARPAGAQPRAGALAAVGVGPL